MNHVKRSKIGLTFLMTLSIILGYGPAISEATAATSKRTASVKKVSKSSKSKKAASLKVGGALRRKKSHSFDGMTVEGLNGGRYDSITSLSEGGDRGGNRLYSLPANFSYRAADEKSEMRYRQ